jgi:hypothetical protein
VAARVVPRIREQGDITGEILFGDNDEEGINVR